MAARARGLRVKVILVVGLGLIVAPFAFSMFHRAPQGAEMIDDFRSFMTAEQVTSFRGYLETIDAADTESRLGLRSELVDTGAVDSGADYAARYPATVALNDDWPDIQSDMTDLLDRMEDNLDNYAAVDALPDFALFPWFFVLPGIVVSALALVAITLDSSSPWRRRSLWGLVVTGVAIAVAPVVFQMFTRAPQGAEMIDDFRPMMTAERVQDVQGYFISMGAAEGELRNGVLPLVGDTEEYPGVVAFSELWPTIVTDFAPMVSAMNDNVDNFEAIDALPDFALFPWFFVVPGVLVAVLALRERRLMAPAPDAQVSVPTESQPTSV